MIPPDSPVLLTQLSAQRDGPLPTGYWCRGVLIESPMVGRTLRVWRTERAAQSPDEVAPVKRPSIYVSSPVQSIEERADGSVMVATMNSQWLITPEAQSAGESKSGLDTAP